MDEDYRDSARREVHFQGPGTDIDESRLPCPTSAIRTFRLLHVPSDHEKDSILTQFVSSSLASDGILSTSISRGSEEHKSDLWHQTIFTARDVHEASMIMTRLWRSGWETRRQDTLFSPEGIHV